MTLADVLACLRAAEGEGFASLVDAAGRRLTPADPDAGALLATAVSDVTFDSRGVTPGALFICKGATFREIYLLSAVEHGAASYLAQEVHKGAGVAGVVVADIRRAMAHVACAFFGNPSKSLSVVGITGTKGKTTVAFYVDAIMRAWHPGRRSGLLTGVVIDDGITRSHARNTTPEAVELQRHLATARDAGCAVVVMEASSQGFKYDRTLGTHFAVGAFTNIGEDHVSPVEHPTFEDYFASKLRIFGQSDVAVVNAEADHADRILQAARAACSRVLTYALRDDSADVYLTSLNHVSEGVWRLNVATPSGALDFEFRALGQFNVSNALAAVAIACALGVEGAAIESGLADVRVPGRMERYDAPDGSIVGIVDYAHNEMSMRALLTSAREEFPGREVTVVFGSCGTRGTDRRPGLGRAAGSLADRVILTEDDPGPVDVRAICEEIGAAVVQAGSTYEVEPDRPSAVRKALEGAHRPAVVLLAGKGAEGDILRAGGVERCDPDAKLLCEGLGIPFRGYEAALGA